MDQYELYMALFLFMIRPLYLSFYLYYKGALKLVQKWQFKFHYINCKEIHCQDEGGEPWFSDNENQVHYSQEIHFL